MAGSESHMGIGDAVHDGPGQTRKRSKRGGMRTPGGRHHKAAVAAAQMRRAAKRIAFGSLLDNELLLMCDDRARSANDGVRRRAELCSQGRTLPESNLTNSVAAHQEPLLDRTVGMMEEEDDMEDNVVPRTPAPRVCIEQSAPHRKRSRSRVPSRAQRAQQAESDGIARRSNRLMLHAASKVRTALVLQHDVAVQPQKRSTASTRCEARRDANVCVHERGWRVREACMAEGHGFEGSKAG